MKSLILFIAPLFFLSSTNGIKTPFLSDKFSAMDFTKEYTMTQIIKILGKPSKRKREVCNNASDMPACFEERLYYKKYDCELLFSSSVKDEGNNKVLSHLYFRHKSNITLNDSIKIGVSDTSQVKRFFGPPTFTVNPPDNLYKTYSYENDSISPIQFFHFDFDAQGKLYSFSL